MDHPELMNTEFGEVLVELLEERGLPATPEQIETMARESGLDHSKLLDRMASTDAEDFGDLRGLADVIGLSSEEKSRVPMAFAYDRRRESE